MKLSLLDRRVEKSFISIFKPKPEEIVKEVP